MSQAFTRWIVPVDRPYECFPLATTPAEVIRYFADQGEGPRRFTFLCIDADSARAAVAQAAAVPPGMTTKRVSIDSDGTIRGDLDLQPPVCIVVTVDAETPGPETQPLIGP